MDAAAKNGEILVVDEVVRELERKDDDVYGWVKDRENMIVPIDNNLQDHVVEIMRAYPRLVDSKKSRSGCDPWVIALAQTRGLGVVTAEKASGNIAKPKIPDVCKALRLQCVEVIDFFRIQGWRLS